MEKAARITIVVEKRARREIPPAAVDAGWKHLARQPAISGQALFGQFGQGFMGLWQGISPMDDCDDATLAAGPTNA